MTIDTDKILQGDQVIASRLMRLLEEGDPRGAAALKILYPQTGKARILGMTGPAGAGKSTLIGQIIAEFRQRHFTVGVVAVDPSSPFSGGAFLGDRLRMRFQAEDSGVFIRSMATRGHMGGLSRTAKEIALVLDVMGYDIVLIETVGVGQDEVEVAEFAHTTAVVSLPGMGDNVQAMKAGLLETADIFVVNKADRPEADDVVGQLQYMLNMRKLPADAWQPPIIKTVGTTGEGVAELVDAFEAHRHYLLQEGRLHALNARREYRHFQQMVREMAFDKIFSSCKDSPAYGGLLENLKERKIDPYSAAEMLIKGLKCTI